MDLQLFKKGNETQVITQEAHVPEASPEEKERYQMMNAYIRQQMPTAMALQQKGANMLLSNPGVVPVDYTRIGEEATRKAKELQGDLDGIRANANSGAAKYQQAFHEQADTTNRDLANVRNMSNQATGALTGGLGLLSGESANTARNMARAYGDTVNTTNRALGNNLADTMKLSQNTANELQQVGQQNARDNTDLINQLRGATGVTNSMLGQAYNNYGYNAGTTANRLNQYEQGQQNNAFLENKSKVINDQLKSTLGNAVNNLAQRGVLNSSVANRVFENVADNVADSMNRSYNQDLGLQANLANQANQARQQGQQLQDAAMMRQMGNVDNFVNRAYTMGNQDYGQQLQNALQRHQILNQGLGQAANLTQQMNQNAMNALGQQQNVYNQNLANQGNYFNALSNQLNHNIGLQAGLAGQMGANNQQALASAAQMFNQNISNQANLIDQANALRMAPMQTMNAVQNASIDIPGKILSLATGQSAPNTDAWQTMINNRYRMANPENMHVAQTQGGGGGFFNGLGSALVGAFCVAENSYIYVPSGYKRIEEVKQGDAVITDNHLDTARVTATTGPHKERIISIQTAHFTCELTKTQPVMCNDKWKLAGAVKPGEYILTVDGYEEVEAIKTAGEANVYDLKVDGKNRSYIANGIVMKAGENEWA